jgi:hypothetical protein
MTSQQPMAHESVFKRVLWLYGLYTLLFNAVYLLGYYFLPEGFMRGSPQVAVGRLAATGTFWSEMAFTLLFNLGMVVVMSVILNFNQVKGFPAGYLMPISLGLISGLISGTNSFAASDLKQYNAWDGMALSISVGGVEMLAYILIIASTVSFGVYQYRSWWRWSGAWKPTKKMNLRDVRLSAAELLCLVMGILLLILSAYRETVMAMNM